MGIFPPQRLVLWYLFLVYSFIFDAPCTQRGASRQLKLIFLSVPINPCPLGRAFSAHTGKQESKQ
jgi:hypothetical protein